VTPVALLKAESLIRHAQYLGVRQDEFALALTLGEGYELLDYLASGAMGLYANHEALRADIEAAKVKGDPWEILASWRLLGLEIVKAAELH
jgi:hypothetical protein